MKTLVSSPLALAPILSLPPGAAPALSWEGDVGPAVEKAEKLPGRAIGPAPAGTTTFNGGCTEPYGFGGHVALSNFSAIKAR